jgi:tannase/feruloyl esterase
MRQDPTVRDYFRHYEAPGTGHCFTPGAGLYPAYIFESLQKWVEEGKVPDYVEADAPGLTGTRSRIICAYPQKTKFKGGSSSSQSSYYCE